MMRFYGLALWLLAVPLVFAHPVPKDNYDRTIIVYVAPERVVIDYRLEVSPIRAALDLDRDVLASLKNPEQLPAAYLEHNIPRLTEGLSLSLDGQELRTRCIAQSVVAEKDHVRCDYRFEAPWTLRPDQAHAFAFQETNFPLDTYSLLSLTLAVSPALTVTHRTVPPDEVLAREPDKRRPGDAKLLRVVSATVLATPDSLPSLAKPALPFEGQCKPPLRKTFRSRPWTLKPPGTPHALARTGPGPSVPLETPPPSSTEQWSLLALLLDTQLGLATLLALAAVFGAAHALTPGHGKPLVAAYLIGERGTIWHALVLGLVTTITHTAAVFIAAIVLWLFFPSASLESPEVQASLHILGGLLIAAAGLWLLMQRLAGRADHVHFDDAAPSSDTSWGRLILLGIGGGIVPCHDAILILSLSIGLGRLWLALPLLLSFSAGLSAVLVAVGIAVVKARKLLPTPADSPDEISLGRWDAILYRLGHALPVISAVVIIIIGTWMCFSGAALAH